MFDDSNTTISSVDEILDIETVGGYRVWHLISVISSAVLLLLTLTCCCVSFRIPRTKQEIEADYIRKQITRKFRKRLNSIPDSEMDEMNLIKAVEKLRFQLMPEDERINLLKMNNNSENTSEMVSTTNFRPHTPDRTKSPNHKPHILDTAERASETSTGFSRKFVTIVNAFGIFRPNKWTDEQSSKQMTV